MEFPNLSFSSELADSTSPQFRLQAQALNHYVSGTVDLSVTASPLNDTLERCLTFPLPAEADLAALTLIWFTTAGYQCLLCHAFKTLLSSFSFPFSSSLVCLCILIHLLFSLSALSSSISLSVFFLSAHHFPSSVPLSVSLWWC